ncbi:long-chain fatty acid--CoA ligase [Nocardioides sp. YR527]|uniref:long-chain-fatty-acid--CoA ligase n=1 Tax=Nocardioides sp. YR527 TaxID=1881028 RepID=UPI0015A381E3|nr:long-chain fatty acid--CoA ligase [Nocardioides sp. YR527]
MNANLFNDLARSAAASPDKVALQAGASTITYRELEVLASRVANDLRAAGVQPGDRVAVMLPNVVSFAVTYYGALRAGAAVVPMNPLLKGREVEHYLGDPQVKLLYAWADCQPVVEDPAAKLGTEVRYITPGAFEASLQELPASDDVAHRVEEDTAVILYTSGTTGIPKGAELTHLNLRRNVEVSTSLFSMVDSDVVIGALPLFHAFGQICALNCSVAKGARLVLTPRFEPGSVLATIAENEATMFMGVPTMFNAMLHHPDAKSTDTSSLRMCVSGGASLPLEVLHGFEDTFGCVVLEGYGLSETSAVSSFNRQGQQRPGSIGMPIPGVEIKVIDDAGAEAPIGAVGEIVIKGDNIMKGYWGRPEATAAAIDADGWFRSGDLGRKDEDGFFFIVDRKKDLVIRGGYNVYPREIEEVLYEHPAVRECAVIGIPHAELGEEVGAAVALAEPGAATLDELRQYVRDRVAPYKYPRHIWFVDELPKGATNKILKREIVAPVITTP